MGKHTVYNRYDNPFASPPDLRDDSLCVVCEEKTGFEGFSLHGMMCGFCAAFASGKD